ncbi:hypothetical protein HIM_12512 [Hirsutella minnesotensis 3608]|uniref:Uncharacterized protein n=1 Tax=Hirsutella minnesotensis 3608 TaxID=1043627 RepID=A0A0F7ZQM0_9HYPO|nr:hypothetical protein HIM_12512 [Hirsutella minnesotensis 3608]
MTRFFKFLFLTGLHLVPAIVILGMAARISVDSDNADQGVFKQSFGLNLFARGLPDPLGEVGAQVGNIGGRLGEQATRLPKDVSNLVQSVAAAGESLINQRLIEGLAVGTKYTSVEMGGDRNRLDFNLLYCMLWLCFGSLAISNLAYAVAYWCRFPIVHSIFSTVISLANFAGLGFSVMALWIITGLLGAADKLQVMVQDMFHVKSTVHKGPLLHDFWMVFGFATCHIFTSIICVYFGIDKRQ